jgi:hypothetical protein
MSESTVINPAGQLLVDIIRQLIAHPAARCKLPRGLYLTWRSNDATRGRFQALRIDVMPGDQEIVTVRRDAATAGVRLAEKPTAVIDEHLAGRHWMGYAWDVTLGGTQDRLPLFTPRDVHLEMRG